jgi:hypothetical protein
VSEVDSVGKTGLQPLIPMGDRRQHPDDARGGPPPNQQQDAPDPGPAGPAGPAGPSGPAGPQRPPKSIIDEYA